MGVFFLILILKSYIAFLKVTIIINLEKRNCAIVGTTCVCGLQHLGQYFYSLEITGIFNFCSGISRSPVHRCTVLQAGWGNYHTLPNGLEQERFHDGMDSITAFFSSMRAMLCSSMIFLSRISSPGHHPRQCFQDSHMILLERHLLDGGTLINDL